MNSQITINDREADMAISLVEDPVTRNLLQAAMARARMELLRDANEAEDSWRRRLPEAPFDMRFMIRVLTGLFSEKEIIHNLLAGQTIEEASGWRIP